MDGISISNAMKGVISAQTEKDDSTSAKTYAATDLIQLYANDGTPNGKINRTDFMNAVQASLGSILNGGTAQITGITKVPSLVGNALGATTVANLASVLGVARTISSGSLNDVKTSGNYFVTEVSDSPDGHWGFLVVEKWEGQYNRVKQTYINDTGDYACIRTFKDETWSPWQRLDNFGCNTPADLASLLGVLPPFTGNTAENISPNNLIDKSGVHFVNAGQNGNPDSTSQWIIISNIIYSDSMGGSFGVQFAFAIDNAQAYYRMIWNSIREWKELETEIPNFYKDYSTLAGLSQAIVGNSLIEEERALLSGGIINTGIKYGIIAVEAMNQTGGVPPIRYYHHSDSSIQGYELIAGNDALYGTAKDDDKLLNIYKDSNGFINIQNPGSHGLHLNIIAIGL